MEWCVNERRRTQNMRVVKDVWHVRLGDGDEDFQRILCGQQDGSGINLPGGRQLREPTCPSCITALRMRDTALYGVTFIGPSGERIDPRDVRGNRGNA